MEPDNRRQSQFPNRGPAVVRNRGLSGWRDALARGKAHLERLEAAQKEKDNFPSRRKRAKTRPRSGAGVFRTLMIVAAVLYGASHFSEPLFDFVNSLGDIESFVSGNGDELADQLMEKRSAAASGEPNPSVPASPRPHVRQDGPKPPASQPSPKIAPVARISSLPHYPGAKAMLEDETVGVYVTADPLSKVTDITLALLEDAGWHGRMTAQNEEMRHLTFTRGHQELTAYISIAPRLGNRTSIQYHIVR